MIKIDTHAIELAKTGIFAALGSLSENGERLKIEVDDELLSKAADLALDYMIIGMFGHNVQWKKD